MNRRQAAAEGRRALDRALLPFRELPTSRPPRGWIRAIRDALGMTAEQLGQRMGVSQPTVQKLEVSEAGGAIQLKTLRRAAEALDCELVYVLIPREPLSKTYETAARDLAHRELGLVSHSMTLEDQAVVDEDEDDRLARYIEDELEPREIWMRRP